MQNNQKKIPRHLYRMKAFQFLYGQDFSKAGDLEELKRNFCAFPTQEEQEAEPFSDDNFAWELVFGVWTYSKKLDEIIEQFAKNWKVQRLGRVEHGLLRIAIFEILYRDDVPSKVAINEALELNKQFGEQKSKSFINGILDAVAKAVETKTLNI